MHVDAQATQYDRAPPSPTPQSPHEQLATRLGYDLSLFRDLDEDKRLHADEFLRRPLSAASMATSFNGTPALARSQRGRSGSDASDAAEAVARRTHANLRSLQLQEDAAKEQQQRRRRANPRIRRIPSVGSMGKRVATPSAPVGGAVGLVALAAEERRQQRASALNRSMLLGTAGSSGQSPSPRQLPPSHPTTPVSPVSMRSSSPPLHPAFSPYPFHPVAHAANTRATGGGAGADEGTTVPSLMAGQGRMDHHQVITGSVIVGGNSDKPERAMPRPQSAPWTPQPRQRHDAAEFFTAGSGHQMVYDASQRPRTAFSVRFVCWWGCFCVRRACELNGSQVGRRRQAPWHTWAMPHTPTMTGVAPPPHQSGCCTHTVPVPVVEARTHFLRHPSRRTNVRHFLQERTGSVLPWLGATATLQRSTSLTKNDRTSTPRADRLCTTSWSTLTKRNNRHVMGCCTFLVEPNICAPLRSPHAVSAIAQV